jgi:hypothetical protein
MERDYFNKMQKRIVEVFGTHPFKVEFQSAEEQAAINRIYASLERAIIDKQRKTTQEELEAMFPELRYVHEAENKAAEEKAKAEEAEIERRLEQEKRERELEEKYKAILEGVDKSIQEAKDSSRRADEAQKEAEKERLLAQKAEEEAALQRERELAEEAAIAEAERLARIAAEEKAAAEERARAESKRKLEMEAARKEAARQAEIKKKLGTYYYRGEDDRVEITIILESETSAIWRSIRPQIAECYNKCEVNITGSTIKMKVINRQETIYKSGWSFAYSYRGEFNSSRTAIQGNWTMEYGGECKFHTLRKIG